MSADHADRQPETGSEHRPWQDLDTMLSVDDARERILSSVHTCVFRRVSLSEAHGLVLAEDVVAKSPVPPFRNSAMDGYAVRFADVAGATYEKPVSLRVVANLAAGHEPEAPVGPGEAVRIMTGALVPEGADTVVRFEETSEFAAAPGKAKFLDVVEVRKAPRSGENVREAGEDVELEQRVLQEGTYIGAAELGVLASVNCAEPLCISRPRVGILATGDEVVEPGEPIRPGQIRNSNNYTIEGLVREAGGIPVHLGVASDNAEALRGRLATAGSCDLLITSGGVSVGDYDVVKDVLLADGRIDLWQVRIKPGKPMAFGRLDDIPLIGLPGNPVAAFVAFLLFARPAIRKLRGLDDIPLATLRARLRCEHENRGHRRHFVRGYMREEQGELVVEPVPVQGSGVLTSVVRANCFFVIPEELDHAPAGITVDVVPLARYD